MSTAEGFPELDVEGYVHHLGQRLRGPGRARRDVLQEVRDGLDDASDAHAVQGADRREAERLAVAEFGALDRIARELQRELAVRQARWTAAWSALALVLLWLLWDLVWASRPDLGGAPPVVGGLSRLTDVLGLSTAAACLAGLGLLQFRSSLLGRPERIASVVGRLTLCGVGAATTTSLVMTVVNLRDTAAVLTSAPLNGAVACFTLAGVGALVVSGRRCVRAAELGGPAPAGRPTP
ncbi:hypothetical protein GTQ99_16180 [Kineococcus sp. T13]|uniref:permease prefix domain 1-containing protein n=1 Tax=Kineococcus vitellinus TaxID=2696565 RepID=UPI0014129812|nr:hypothetical protein [Kineococcus vitellinus]